MAILQSLKWINRHGTATALLALLLCLCLAAQTLAISAIGLVRDIPLAHWPERFRRNMLGIQFIHDHPWFVLPYLALFVGLLIYVEIRSVPRWAVWTAFVGLTVPLAGYFLTCIRVGLGSWGTIVRTIPGP